MICRLHNVNATMAISDSDGDELATIVQRFEELTLDVDRGVTLMGVSNMYVDSFDDDWVVLKRQACVNGVDCVIEAKIEAPLIAVAFDILDFHMTHR